MNDLRGFGSDLTNRLSALEYQRNLVTERNRLLVLQNESLLSQLKIRQQKIEQLDKEIKTLQMKSKGVEQRSINQRKSMSKLIKIYEKQFGDKLIEIQKCLQDNECSNYIIIDNLCDVLQASFDKENKKIDLNRIEKLLEKRRRKIDQKQIRSKQVVHFVKDISWKQPTTLIEYDLEYILKSVEKIIAKMGLFGQASLTVTKILGQLREFILLRKSIRQSYRQVKIEERNLELGVGCRISLETKSKQLQELQREELEKKRKIEGRISQIKFP